MEKIRKDKKNLEASEKAKQVNHKQNNLSPYKKKLEDTEFKDEIDLLWKRNKSLQDKFDKNEDYKLVLDLSLKK